MPAHIGIPGNEAADKAAKMALGTIEPNIYNKYTLGEIKSGLRLQLNNRWQLRYDTSQTGKFYKELEPKIGKQIKYCHQNRRQEVQITRLRFNHCFVKAHLTRITKEDPNCQYCNKWETVKHLLLECKLYKQQRQNLVKVCKELGMQFNVKSLLGNNTMQQLTYKYLQDIDRKV